MVVVQPGKLSSSSFGAALARFETKNGSRQKEESFKAKVVDRQELFEAKFTKNLQESPIQKVSPRVTTDSPSTVACTSNELLLAFARTGRRQVEAIQSGIKETIIAPPFVESRDASPAIRRSSSAELRDKINDHLDYYNTRMQDTEVVVAPSVVEEKLELEEANQKSEATNNDFLTHQTFPMKTLCTVARDELLKEAQEPVQPETNDDDSLSYSDISAASSCNIVEEEIITDDGSCWEEQTVDSSDDFLWEEETVYEDD